MEALMEVLPILLYRLAIVLVIVFIILGIKLIATIDKANAILDDVERKSKSLNGLFNVIDGVTDTLSILSDTVVASITSVLGKIIPKRKKKERNKEDE